MLTISLLHGKHTRGITIGGVAEHLSGSAFGLAGYIILIYECLDAIPDEVRCVLCGRSISSSMRSRSGPVYMADKVVNRQGYLPRQPLRKPGVPGDLQSAAPRGLAE